MKLDEFISESLKQIIDGIITASEYAETKGAKISNLNVGFTGAKESGARIVYFDNHTSELVEKINFDIAVTAMEGDKNSKGLGLFVAAIAIGANGENAKVNS